MDNPGQPPEASGREPTAPPSPPTSFRERWRRGTALGFLVAAFLLILDFNYRSSILLETLSPTALLGNLPWMGVALGGCAILWGTFTAVLEGWVPRLAERLTLVLSWALLVYVNLIYARMYALIFLPFTAGQMVLPLAGFGLAAVLAWPVLRPRLQPPPEMLSAVLWLGLRATALGAAIAALLLVPGLAGGAPQRSSGRPHVLFLTADSLGAANMSLYGTRRDTTPHLEALGARSYVFENAMANSNATYFSMPCFMGYLPSKPGLERNPERPLLTTLLGERGYRQRVFLSFTTMDPSFRSGFTEVEVPARALASPPFSTLNRWSPGSSWSRDWLAGLASEQPEFFSLTSSRNPKDFNDATVDPFPARVTLDRALYYLRQSEEPLFLWAHLFPPHHPFSTSPPFRGRFGTALADRYDAAVAEMDAQLGLFFKQLREAGLEDRVLVVVSSDHGESFGLKEGGWRGRLHGTNWTNREVVWIPLLIHLPGQERGQRVRAFAQQADVAPTLLDLLGAPIPAAFEGESLRPFMEDPARPSGRVKVSVPESWFLRQEKPFQSRPPAWVTEKEEMFVGVLQPYRVGWFQVYDQEPGAEPGWITALRDVLPYGIHDLEKDPELQHPLGKAELEPTLKKLFNDPVVARYRRLRPAAGGTGGRS